LAGLFNWNRRRGEPTEAAVMDAVPADPITRTKVLPHFLTALDRRPEPVLLDLGAAVGPNVTFFGERLACRILVRDLFEDIERHHREDRGEGLLEVLTGRLPDAPESVDGVLCWDLFDFLDETTGKQLAARLAGLLRPGGVLYGFFGTTPIDLTHYTRYVIEAEDTLRHRSYPATPTQRNVLLTREVNRMFDPLVASETVLLKSSTRETLFRKAV
jgi:hypothetical protein